MYVRTNEDLNRAILYGMRKIPDDIDLIVGIPRSGLHAALLFSLYLNKPLTDLNGVFEGRLISSGQRPVRHLGKAPIADARRILIVDDSIGSGDTMDRARQRIEEAGLAHKAVFLSVYCAPERLSKVDIFLEVLPRPRVFQWNVMNHGLLKQSCVDIDGILCADPTREQNDDGARYRDFLRTATPLFTPLREIGWLVTARLEKYRPETEEWMARHDIRFRNLVMMDHVSLKERRRANRDAEYKAEVYKRTGARLFIESSPILAQRIAEITDRPVLCFETHELINPASQRIDVAYQKIAHTVGRFRRAPRKLWRLATETPPKP